MKEGKNIQSFIFKIGEIALEPEIELEDNFRNCICALEKRCKTYTKVSQDCTFKIFLYVENYNGLQDDTKNIVS